MNLESMPGRDRDSGLTLTEFVDNPEHIGKVNCDGCTACCHFYDIEIRPGDNTEHLQTEMRDGKHVLKKNGNACIHLGPEGCTVHEHRPQVCRHYDCRLFSAAHIRVNHIENDGADHTSAPVEPTWSFKIQTKRARLYNTALMLASVQYSVNHPKAPAPEILEYSMNNFRKLFPLAEDLLKAVDAMSPAQKQQLSLEMSVMMQNLAARK